MKGAGSQSFLVWVLTYMVTPRAPSSFKVFSILQVCARITPKLFNRHLPAHVAQRFPAVLVSTAEIQPPRSHSQLRFSSGIPPRLAPVFLKTLSSSCSSYPPEILTSTLTISMSPVHRPSTACKTNLVNYQYNQSDNRLTFTHLQRPSRGQLQTPPIPPWRFYSSSTLSSSNHKYCLHLDPLPHYRDRAPGP